MLAVVEDRTRTRTVGAAPDNELLLAVGRGDRGRPLRELYGRYSGRVYGLGVQLLADRGLAEELVQETFVRLWRNAGRFDPERGTAATFIFTIARRLAIDLWRRPSSRPASPQPVPEPNDEQVDQMLVGLEVRDAMNSLSEAHRQVLELSYRQQLKQTEIAERLGVPLGTVKTRSYHALRSLRAELEQRGIHG